MISAVSPRINRTGKRSDPVALEARGEAPDGIPPEAVSVVRSNASQAPSAQSIRAAPSVTPLARKVIR